MRAALLATFLLVASGCIARANDGTASPSATATGQPAENGTVVVAGPMLPPPPAHDPTNVTWHTDATLNETTLRFIVEPQVPDTCDVSFRASGAATGTGPDYVVLLRVDGGIGLGWGSSGSLVRAHLGGLDTDQVLAPGGGGFGGSFDRIRGELRTPLEILVAAHQLAPFPPESPHFMGIGDHAVQLDVKCSKPVTVRAERGGAPGLWDASNLSGGAGATGFAFLLHPFADVEDKGTSKAADAHTTVAAAVLLDNVARVGLDRPGGHDDWLLTPEEGLKTFDGGPGDYAATVDAVGTGYISGFLLLMASTTPVSGLDALAP
jgi:hypothetical protein